MIDCPTAATAKRLVFTGALLAVAMSSGFAAAAQPLPIAAEMASVGPGVYEPFFRASTDAAKVPVKRFCIDVRPVTQGDYLEFVRANPNWRRSRVARIFADDAYLKNWAGDLDLGTNANAQIPVTGISWFAAKAYAHWKGKRLPTTAEWEYVAAAGYGGPDGRKEPAFIQQVLLWYSTPAPAQLPAAGSGKPNFWGVSDLHGLVWEWVADFSSAMVTGDSRSDNGLDRQLFCGAGSQGSKDLENYPAFMRYGFRSSLKANYCIHNLGFRCAKDL